MLASEERLLGFVGCPRAQGCVTIAKNAHTPRTAAAKGRCSGEGAAGCGAGRIRASQVTGAGRRAVRGAGGRHRRGGGSSAGTKDSTGGGALAAGGGPRPPAALSGGGARPGPDWTGPGGAGGLGRQPHPPWRSAGRRRGGPAASSGETERPDPHTPDSGTSRTVERKCPHRNVKLLRTLNSARSSTRHHRLLLRLQLLPRRACSGERRRRRKQGLCGVPRLSRRGGGGEEHVNPAPKVMLSNRRHRLLRENQTHPIETRGVGSRQWLGRGRKGGKYLNCLLRWLGALSGAPQRLAGERKN